MKQFIASLLITLLACCAPAQSKMHGAKRSGFSGGATATGGGGCNFTFTDNCVRANENPLTDGGKWHVVTGQLYAQLLSNQIIWTNVSAGNAEMYTDDGVTAWTNCPNQTATARIVGGPSVTSATGWGPTVRVSPTARTYYECIIWSSSIRLLERISGVGNTTLATIANTYVAGAPLTLSVTGSDLPANVTLTVKYNGVTLTNLHPQNVITNGFPGFRYSSQDSTGTMAITNYVASSP